MEYDFLKHDNGQLSYCEPEDADFVLVPIKEFNGFEKAVRIVRDRALQQIDKSTADEHGYKLLRADFKRYNYDIKEKAWLIVRSTPYSVKMSLSDAKSIIERDLRDFYGFRETKNIPVYDDDGVPATFISFDAGEILRFYDIYYLRNGNRKAVQNSDMLRKLEFMDESDGKFAFEIARISCNAAAGVYEVSYWATDTM